jgi:hypothetical protein
VNSQWINPFLRLVLSRCNYLSVAGRAGNQAFNAAVFWEVLPIQTVTACLFVKHTYTFFPSLLGPTFKMRDYGNQISDISQKFRPTWEAKAGGSQVQFQPGLYSKTLYQNTNVVK